MGALHEEVVRGLQRATAKMASWGCVPKPAVSGVGAIKLRRARVELDKGGVSGRGTGVRVWWWRVRVVEGTKEYSIGPGRRIRESRTGAQVVENRRNRRRKNIVVGGSVQNKRRKGKGRQGDGKQSVVV